MTINEYEQRLDALARQIADLKLEVFAVGSEIPPHHRPEMKLGERYYYIEGDGDIHSCKWWKEKCDLDRFAIGNAFRTKDAAEYAAEYYKVLGEMREWAGKWDDPWRIVYIANNIRAVSVYSGKGVTYGELRFACKDDAENCIRVIGEDRLIKYYFGVRDHEIPAETE